MATGVLVIGVGKGCRELGNYLQVGEGTRLRQSMVYMYPRSEVVSIFFVRGSA